MIGSRWVDALRRKYPRFWSFIARRFARGEYLGLHLTVGFILTVGALWLFGGITEDVINSEALVTADLHLATWVRGLASPSVDHIAVAITTLGSPITIGILGCLVAVSLAMRRRGIVLAGWVAAYAGGPLLNWVAKNAVHRSRPVGSESFLYGSSFSFPSGHAMGSLICYGMLAYVLIAFVPSTRGYRKAIVVSTAVLVVLIGVTRVYLGVHYLSDVIAGFAAGTAWLAVCITGIEVAERQRRFRSPETPTAETPRQR